jgi:hypothetical protein
MFLFITHVIRFHGDGRLDKDFILVFIIVVNGAIVFGDHHPSVFALK